MNASTVATVSIKVLRGITRRNTAFLQKPRQPTRNLHPLALRRAYPSPTSSAPQIRHHSSEAAPEAQRPLTDRDSVQSNQAAEIAARKAEQPSYQLTFTCKQCSERSSHHVTKQSYHFGTTLITCPGCKSRHLISDHLKIFNDTGVTLEDIMKEKGQLLRKGRLGEDGDIEFYDEGETAEVMGVSPARRMEKA